MCNVLLAPRPRSGVPDPQPESVIGQPRHRERSTVIGTGMALPDCSLPGSSSASFPSRFRSSHNVAAAIRTMWLLKLDAAAVVGFTKPRSHTWCTLLKEQSIIRPAFVAGLTTTATCLKIQYPPRPKPPPDEDITEVYLKGSGPGGQKINKTSSAVQLKHIPTGIVIKCQETRSRSQNRKLAREHLAEKIDDFLNGENSRSAVVARINARKKASAHKKSRRKHAQAEGKGGSEEVGNIGDDGDVLGEIPPERIETSGQKEEPSQ